MSVGAGLAFGGGLAARLVALAPREDVAVSCPSISRCSLMPWLLMRLSLLRS